MSHLASSSSNILEHEQADPTPAGAPSVGQEALLSSTDARKAGGEVITGQHHISASTASPSLPAQVPSSTIASSAAAAPQPPSSPSSNTTTSDVPVHGLTQPQYEALNQLYDNEPARLQLYQSYVRPSLQQLLHHQLPVGARALEQPLLVLILSYLPLPPLPYYLQLQLEVQAQIQQQLAELELQQSVVDLQLHQQRDRANEQLENKLRRRQWLQEMYADERSRTG